MNDSLNNLNALCILLAFPSLMLGLNSLNVGFLGSLVLSFMVIEVMGIIWDMF